MRLLAITEFGVGASWLQPILMEAEKGGALPRSEYNSAIVNFVESGFEFISVDAGLLVWTLHATKGVTLTEEFLACVRRLGGPKADLRSHIGVAAKTIRATWYDYNLSPTLRRAIAGVLLDNLCKDRSLDEIANIVCEIARLDTGVALYVAGWVQGHFLPMSILGS